VVDPWGRVSKDQEEPVDNLITWVFEEGTFKPAAKLVKEKAYSIITDYLGTPKEAYDWWANKVWAIELEAYGKVKSCEGWLGTPAEESFIPFRFQGQYHDVETGLYYNRFRYYSPEEGMYVTAQDPVRLRGGNRLYSYVHDPNTWIDMLGLTPFSLDDIANLGSMNRQQISEMISENYSDVLEYKGGSPDGRFMQWKYKDTGTTAVRIDPPDKVTLYDHIHLYDTNGNPLDVNGNIGSVDSPDVHIKIQCN